MAAKIISIITSGAAGLSIEIECHVSNNLPAIVIVGFANKAVNEAKERLRGAFASSNLQLPRKRITVNLAPASIPKADSGFDLAIAMSIALHSEDLAITPDRSMAFIGELGLDGSVRPVRGIIGKLLYGRSRGITTYFISADNLQQAQLVPGVRIFPIAKLKQLIEHFTNTAPMLGIKTGNGKLAGGGSQPVRAEVCLEDITGQDQAKRALEIAAAGGHNVLLIGPPGTGKSMLAKALAGLLPPLSQEETLEVTHLHSLAGYDYGRLVRERPFRAPHHSASHTAIIGGGASLRPGEVSLSHRGVLFFDELPEFSRPSIEALRQPLEDQIISVMRAKDSATFPASFILVATANPCPCGYYGTSLQDCRCPEPQRLRYQQKLSGPIIDRIDLFCNVDAVDHSALLRRSPSPAGDDQTHKRVKKARVVQLKRFTTSTTLNADMSNAQLKQFAKLSDEARQTLDRAAAFHNLSARSYMRVIKVARTIADLEGSKTTELKHITEALAYKQSVTIS